MLEVLHDLKRLIAVLLKTVANAVPSQGPVPSKGSPARAATLLAHLHRA